MTPSWPDDPSDWDLPAWMFDEDGVLTHDLDEFDRDEPAPTAA
jgi:hypothetical protein